jgi:DNA polymerase III epsilon subunit-like protein
VELAAIAFDDEGTVLETFSELVYPGMSIPPDATGTHGLGDADVASKSVASDVLSRFLSWLPNDAVMIAHNARYDQGVISWECQRAGLRLPACEVIDTRALARSVRATQDCRLETLVEHYGLSPLGKAHRALADADMVRQYFQIARKITPPAPEPWAAQYEYPSTLPEHLRDLPSWVASGHTIRFTYKSSVGKASSPSIVPYGWAELHGGRLRIHGWCEWAGGRRMFDAFEMSHVIKV